MTQHIEPVTYEYRGKTKNFDMITTDDQIATVCITELLDDGTTGIQVSNIGMDYKAICETFPPDRRSKARGKEYSLVALIRSIIHEAYQNEVLEPGDVRNFWYTHLKFVIEDVLKLGETNSVKSAINTAWGDLIISGKVTYEEMNIESGKENVRRSFVRDSPFSHLIVAVEKEDLFNKLEWIPELFNSTLLTAGGQPSRAVARKFIKELGDNGVDMDQQFYMCTISDLDPAGYYIQRAFADQFEKAIEYYGGHGKIAIERLFVRKDQVTPELLKYQAMKCEDINAKSASAKKAEDTKWEYFCKVTDGGLYKVEGGKKYRAKLELNAFSKRVLEQAILDELLKIIVKTTDESLIMIPEIMRIFSQMKEEVIEDIFKRHKDDWLQPFIDEFLRQTEDFSNDMEDKTQDEIMEEHDRHNEEIEPIEEKYKEERDVSKAEKNQIVDEMEDIIYDYREDQGYNEREERIDNAIKRLEDMKEEMDNDTQVHCQDQFNTIDEARADHDQRVGEINQREDEELQPYKKTLTDNLNEIDLRGEYREEMIEKFRRERATIFNPVAQELKGRLKRMMDDPEFGFWYADLEGDDRTQPHIARLMSEPDTLLVDGVSAWDNEDFPVFEEDDLLRKASAVHDRNVEAHRRGFTSDFTDAMKDKINEVADTKEIVYPDVPIEARDLTAEIEQLEKQIAQDISEKKHIPPKEAEKGN